MFLGISTGSFNLNTILNKERLEHIIVAHHASGPQSL